MKMTRYLDMLEIMIRWTVVVLLVIMVAAIGSQVFARYVVQSVALLDGRIGQARDGLDGIPGLRFMPA